MKLSVVAMFCDTDAWRLPAFIENCKTALRNVEHELILVDNRNDRNSILPILPEEVTVITRGKNLYLWTGRRFGFTAATGDYIWFVDIDDLLLTLPADVFDGRTEDLIQFNVFYADEEQAKLSDGALSVEYTASCANFFNRTWQKMIKNMVWNKFYSHGLLERVFTAYPIEIDLVFSEDMLLNLLVLSELHSIRFDPRAYYTYFFERGDSTKKKYDDIKNLKRLMTGFDSAMAFMYKLLPEDVQKGSGIKIDQIYYGSFLFFIKKFSFCTEAVKRDYIKLLKKYFRSEYIKERLPGVDLTEDEKKEVLKILRFGF